jgi:hypothetical protein
MNVHPELELMVYVFIDQKTTCKVQSGVLATRSNLDRVLRAIRAEGCAFASEALKTSFFAKSERIGFAGSGFGVNRGVSSFAPYLISIIIDVPKRLEWKHCAKVKVGAELVAVVSFFVSVSISLHVPGRAS